MTTKIENQNVISFRNGRKPTMGKMCNMKIDLEFLNENMHMTKIVSYT